jgi:SAM-dependent methyltransferase
LIDLYRRWRSPDRRWAHRPPSPWTLTLPDQGVVCPICRWTGARFRGEAHVENSFCERCDSITRDRFLFWAFVARMPHAEGLRVWETSPRMGARYRRAMSTWFRYLCSDFDERNHRGVVRIDLQRVALPDASVDVLLTPHVLEHVPDTGAALAEIHRVLAPGGRMFLQVPLLQGTTAPPTEPEFHDDDTPVFWRFGPDLTARLRDAGFDTVLLCTEEFRDAVREGRTDWPGATSPEFDVPALLAACDPADLVPVADAEQAARLGIEPSYQVLTWECVKR